MQMVTFSLSIDELRAILAKHYSCEKENISISVTPGYDDGPYHGSATMSVTIEAANIKLDFSNPE